MLFPAGKVANVARVANEGRPGAFDIHDSLVETDWEEHHAVLFALFLQSCFYLLLDPLTGKRVPREDQQQFIVETDRFFDTGADSGTDLQVFWCKTSTVLPCFGDWRRDAQRRIGLCWSS